MDPKNYMVFSFYPASCEEMVNSFFLLFWIHDHGKMFLLGVKLFCFAYVFIYCKSKKKLFFVQGTPNTLFLNLYIIFSQRTLCGQYLGYESLKELILIWYNHCKLISIKSTWNMTKTTWKGPPKPHETINFCTCKTKLGQKMGSVLV